jgi:hypothetical protein
MDDKPDIELPEPTATKKGGSSAGGLVILSLILAVCVVVAYYLSTILTKPPAIGEIVTMEEVIEPEIPAAEGPSGPMNTVEPVQRPREGIEALTLQLRGLASLVGEINSWRGNTGRYPLTIDELVEGTDYTLPDNPYNPSTPVIIVQPGDFSPGGIGYQRYISVDGRGKHGFILFAYADTPENGVTLLDPAEMILPAVFDPPIEVALPGVIAAMDENGNTLDVGRFVDR